MTLEKAPAVAPAFAETSLGSARQSSAELSRTGLVTVLAGFALSNAALCRLPPSIGLLVGARLLQGMAAALLVPQVLATIQAASTGEARARAIGYYGASAGISAVAGQILGGTILTLDVAGYGWRPVFMINVPIGLAILLLARHVPDTRAERKPGVDFIGTVLFGLAVVCVLMAVVEGGALGWPAWLWALLAVAAVAAVALVRFERRLDARGGAPLLPPSILSQQSMRTGLLAVVPFSVGYGSLLFVVIGLLAIFSVIVFRISLVLPQPR